MIKRVLLTVILLSVLASCVPAGLRPAQNAQETAFGIIRAANIKNLCLVSENEAQEIYGMDENKLAGSLYGLSEYDESKLCIYLPKNALSVNEIAVFACTSDSELDRAKLAVSYRLSALMDTYRGVPPLYERLADARYGKCGDHYYFIVASAKKADAAEMYIKNQGGKYRNM